MMRDLPDFMELVLAFANDMEAYRAEDEDDLTKN